MFDIALDLHLVRTRWLGPVVQGHGQSLSHTPFSDAGNGGHAGAHLFLDFHVGKSRARVIRQEEDAGMG
ncbi:MAG TPA: hypothetical protein VN203_21855 [Candidatus Acidoferrum sp.]|nr:hypothetical protein [Candidatus Acidoferrum sp.]